MKASNEEAGCEGRKDSGVRVDRHRTHLVGDLKRDRRGFRDARRRTGAGLPTRSVPDCGSRSRSPRGWPPAAASADPPWRLRRPLSSSDSSRRRHHRFRPRALRPAPSKRHRAGGGQRGEISNPGLFASSYGGATQISLFNVIRRENVSNMSCILFHEENKARINSDLPLPLGLSLPVRAPELYACATRWPGPRACRRSHFRATPTRNSRGRVTESHSEGGTGLLALRQPSQRLPPRNHGPLASLWGYWNVLLSLPAVSLPEIEVIGRWSI